MMKDSNENTYSVYSYLSRRSTEQLDEMLSLNLQQEIDDFDAGIIVMILRRLEERERDTEYEVSPELLLLYQKLYGLQE